MDPKMHRYMQRIQKIMGTPNRANTPIRPAKSPFKNRANNLDQYLKYELSSKIINKIINKNHQHLVINFFNMIKSSEYRQKEKIYKFVAIERKQVKIDRGITAKLLHAVLRQLIKNRFHHFVYNLTKEEQSSNFLYKKTNKQDAMRSAQLLRTASKPEQSDYRQVSEWIDDMQTLNEKVDLIKKIGNMKRYVSRTILRNIGQKYKRVLQQGYRSIVGCRRVVLNQSLSTIKPEKSSKLNKTSFETPSKQVGNFMNDSSKLKNKDKILLIEQQQPRFNLDFIKIVQKLMVKQKQLYIQNNKLVIRQALGIKKSKRQMVKNSQYYNCISKLDQFFKLYMKKYMNLIKKGKSEKQINNNARGVLILTQVIKKKIFQNESVFLRALLLISQKYLNKKQNFLQVQDVIEQPSSISVESKLTLRKSSIISLNAENPLTKLNFYTFVDKIFKMILIVSKLLIPLKQSFDRINQYALFSYDVQQKFKYVSLNRLRSAFKEIKSCKTSDTSRAKLLRATGILQLAIRQKCVQSFSYMKILSKLRESSIKLYPIKSNIVEMTKQFIEERNMYSQHSFDYWNKVRENIFEEESVNSERLNKGKKSIYTAI